MRALCAILVALLAWLAAERPAGAVPSFARRYGTSCQTCHVVFPKLTPFGEAFRRNLYRFPAGEDEDYLKQEPLALGAEAYKDVFPDAVWPGAIPPELPLSLLLAANATARDDDGDTEIDLAGLGSVSLNAAATFGDWLAAWAGVQFAGSTDGEAEVELERVFVVAAPFGPALGLRLGRFEPTLLAFSSHRMLGLGPWLLGTPVGDGAFTLEPSQLGAELTGVLLAGRGSYALGLVQGAGDRLAEPNDLYGSVAYKLGGLRLDGETPKGDESSKGDESAGSPAPWREWSTTVGAFGWAGLSEVGADDAATQGERFYRVGGNVAAQLRDVSLLGAYTFGHDDRPLLAAPSESVRSHHVLVQVDYVPWPWFVPSLRYERRILRDETADRFGAVAYWLARANVRATLLGAVERPSEGNVRLDRAIAGATVAF